jgi:hypothetical protein
MRENTSKTPHIALSVRYPRDWSYAPKCVPDLVVPRELFSVSNRPIRLTPLGSGQPRPMIDGLDPESMFVWCYYQLPGDPDPASVDPVPDYHRLTYPLRYAESEVFASTDAREWSSRDFLWRRLGFVTGAATVTVWIWEGTQATSGSIGATEKIVSSVEPV